MRFAGSTMFFGYGDAAWADVDARLRRLAAAIKLVSSHVKPDHREAARQTLARMRGEEVA